MAALAILLLALASAPVPARTSRTGATISAMRGSIAVAGMAALMMALGTYFLLQESQARNRTAWPDSANRGREPRPMEDLSNRSLAQTLALLFGVAFLAAGVLGFIPGITQDLGDIKFAGKDSPAELLGIFKVSILHNIVHLLFGVAGVALSRTTANAKMYLLYSGVIYIVLTAFGLFVDSGGRELHPGEQRGHGASPRARRRPARRLPQQGQRRDRPERPATTAPAP